MGKNLFSLTFIALILHLLLSVSCGSDAYNTELARVDSLIAVLDSSEAMLHSIDTAQTIASYKVYTANISKIRTEFHSRNDTLVWSVITRYGLIRKPLRDYKKHFINFTNEINTTRKQLSDLKADIRKNVLTPDNMVRYINDEAAFVNYIYLSVQNITANTSHYLNLFNELNPQVEKFLAEHKI